MTSKERGRSGFFLLQEKLHCHLHVTGKNFCEHTCQLTKRWAEEETQKRKGAIEIEG